jgi:uncharacterized Zn-finger protein
LSLPSDREAPRNCIKLREEFEADQQELEQTKKAEATEIENEHEKLRLAVSEPSDDSEMSYESEASDKMDKDSEGEELPAMFTFQATADSSTMSLKKVPVSRPEVLDARTLRTKRQKPFQCLICSKTLSSKDNLRSHIETVHEKKTRFTCPHCPKAFYYKHTLQDHISSHTFTNDDTTNSYRPFECDVDNCGKFFKTKGQLKQHQRVVHLSD